MDEREDKLNGMGEEEGEDGEWMRGHLGRSSGGGGRGKTDRQKG